MKNHIKRFQSVIVFKKVLIQKLLPGMIVIMAITALLSVLHLKYDILNIKMSAALPGYMGAALGLLLVFRNNSAYDKWWEARKEIGSLVNTSRNISLMLNGILPPGHEEKKHMSTLIVGFVYALKEHLRDGVKTEDLNDLYPDDLKIVIEANHKPVMIVNLMVNKIEYLYQKKFLSDIQQLMLIEKINGLIDILGRCERIRNTPIPMAYGFLLKFFIYVYVVFLPLGLLNDIGWGCLPLVMILYYLLMSIVITAEEIEEPFGDDLNDISMDEIAGKIKNNIIEISKLD